MKQTDISGLTWRVTPDLLGFMDRTGAFVATNPAWARVLGLSDAEVENRRFSELIHPDDLARTEAAFRRISGGVPVLNFVNRFRRQDGDFEWISWNAVPEEGCFFCSGRCITADKENEAALRTREEEAKLREQFIAVLGHDVRNPLAAIDAATRMIGRTSDDAQIAEMVSSIEGSTARIARLIDDVMDFARTRLGGGLNLDAAEDHDVKPILEHAVQEIELAHPEAEIVTEYDFCDPIHCDGGRIAQLISNLLANAVLHGEDGAPVIVSAQDRDGSFYLWVTNRGAPISPEVREMLFEPFARDNAVQSQEGLGLGLYIAREIARAHGGDLTMRCEGGNTIFTFQMPRD